MTAPPCQAALDSAGKRASFALARDGELLVNVSDLPAGRASAGLLPALLRRCLDAGVELAAIRRWTVGMGPGSFTGIRVAAALVKGLCAGTGADYRGLPSSLAMAAAARPAPGQDIGVLHDARKGQFILSVYHRDGDALTAIGPPGLIDVDALATTDLPRLAILADDRAVELVPAAIHDRLVRLPAVDAAALLDPPGWPWPADPAAAEAGTEPVYVRPAVFVPPRPVSDLARRLNSSP